jgi:hypothetical protein
VGRMLCHLEGALECTRDTSAWHACMVIVHGHRCVWLYRMFTNRGQGAFYARSKSMAIVHARGVVSQCKTAVRCVHAVRDQSLVANAWSDRDVDVYEWFACSRKGPVYVRAASEFRAWPSCVSKGHDVMLGCVVEAQGRSMRSLFCVGRRLATHR